ncbi:type II secretion system protein [Cryobacterium sp. SO1]|uniref:type II secretion system protein n=1 Tax=Cryobacterium sp. SO1 TaxID=1897061 RepID=UPI0010D98EE5|nr:type II secretion system protein [Cryobacterium sp. SO1]RZI37364.1 hypothetical protein BJQ95_00194 [Cryobacterium sp. SO1]
MELPVTASSTAPVAPPQPEASEDGMTLLELVVAMGIFMIFIALILTTTVTLAQSATRAQMTAEASNSTLVVFGNFDRQARYADSVNYPGSGPSGARYVEFRTAGIAAAGTATCTQWRFVPSLSRLESRSWKDVSGVVLPGFTTKLTNVIDDGGATYPFTLTPANLTGAEMQQLTVTVHSGNAGLQAEAAMSTTFTARNSSPDSPSNKDADGNKVSDTPICNATGYRP